MESCCVRARYAAALRRGGGGRWTFERPNWEEIELPNYRLPKIT